MGLRPAWVQIPLPAPKYLIQVHLKVRIEEIVRYINSQGYIVPTTVIKRFEDVEIDLDEARITQFLLEQGSIIIDEESITSFLERYITKTGETEEELEIDIFLEHDNTRINDPAIFQDLLRSRYENLRRRVVRSIGTSQIYTASSLFTDIALKKDIKTVYVAGLVYSKRVMEDRVTIELEDLSGMVTATVYKNTRPQVYNTVVRLPLDTVVGLKLRVGNEGRLVIEDVYLPKTKSLGQTGGADTYVALISDIHVGSKKFNEELFLEFIDILRGETDNTLLREIVRKTKALLIAGDLVDGVGVYPNQEKELEIDDLWQQYEYAYSLISKIPRRIKVIIIPGNHDASRNALPQPPIFKKFAGKLYEDTRVYMLPNPVNIGLQGVNTYIYHGDYIQDLLTSTPTVDLDDVASATRIMINTGHVASNLSLNTKVFPTPNDSLILPTSIDLLHFGHTHKFRIMKINGVLTINSGTFQEQTTFQKMMKIEPDVGKVAFIHLEDLKPLTLDLSA